MWFKNLQIYRLHAGWNIGVAALNEQLARGAFEKCTSNQPMSRGWIQPRQDGMLTYSNNGQILIALQIEERILPSSVVNEEVKERAETMAEQQGYAPGRKRLRELKERVIEELMPRAFTKKRITHVWIDLKNGWFVVDAGSMSKAEEVIDHLRLCLDEFPLKPLRTQITPTSAMSDWLASEEAPSGFTIDCDCELKSVSEDRALVKYARGHLDHEQVKTNLAAGKLPTKLALTWDDRISFVLTENLDIKRLAFLDLLKEQAEKNAEHADEQFDADFALMTGELVRFIPRLVDVLGGEVIDLAEQGGGAPAKKSGDKMQELNERLADIVPDAAYEEAVLIVRSTQRASISLVQRQLRIGYNRAAMFIERMEREGIVSAMNANGERSVLPKTGA